jgi:hypothetical protein
MSRAGLTFDRIKRIDDGDEFLDSLPREHGGAELQVVLEPAFLPKGRVRVVLVQRG